MPPTRSGPREPLALLLLNLELHRGRDGLDVAHGVGGPDGDVGGAACEVLVLRGRGPGLERRRPDGVPFLAGQGHSNLAPGSSEVKANVALDFLVRVGPAVNLLTGAVVSHTP